MQLTVVKVPATAVGALVYFWIPRFIMDLNFSEKPPSTNIKRNQNNYSINMSESCSYYQYMHNSQSDFPFAFNSGVNSSNKENFPVSHIFTNSQHFNFDSDCEVGSNTETWSQHNFPNDVSFHSAPQSVTNIVGMEGSILSSNNVKKCTGNFTSKCDVGKYYNNNSLISHDNTIKHHESGHLSNNFVDINEVEKPENVIYEHISTILDSDMHFKGIKIPISSSDNKKHNFNPPSDPHNNYTIEYPLQPIRKYKSSQSDHTSSVRNVHDKYNFLHPSSKNSEDISYETENPIPSTSIPENGSNSQNYAHKFNEDFARGKAENSQLLKRGCSYQNICPITNSYSTSHESLQTRRVLRSSESTSYDKENPLPIVSNDNDTTLGGKYLSLIRGYSPNKNSHCVAYNKPNVSVPSHSGSISYRKENPLGDTSSDNGNINIQQMEYSLSRNNFSQNQSAYSGKSTFKVPIAPVQVIRSSDNTSYEIENPLPIKTSVEITKMDIHKMKTNFLNDALKRSTLSEQSKMPGAFFKPKQDNLSSSECPKTTSSSSDRKKNISTNSEEKDDSSLSRDKGIQNVVSVSNSDISSESESSLNRQKKDNGTSDFEMLATDGDIRVLPAVESAENVAHMSNSDMGQHKMTEDSSSELTVLSVYWRKGYLGASYYSSETTEIHIIPDIVDVNPEFNILHSLYNLVQPKKVIVPAQMPETILSALKCLTGYGTPADVQSLHLEKKLHILPRKEYNLEGCKRRVLLLKLPGEPEESNEDEHLLYLNSIIDMTNESMTQALGILLKWLDIQPSTISVDHSSLEQSCLGYIYLEDLVMINQDTYEALQIFSPRPHPSGFKRGMPGSFREGLSVFGIFNRCKSPIGCKHMRIMLRHPTRNIDTLNARLDVVQFCMHPNNEDTVGNMIICLKNIKSVTRILSRLTRLSASIQEWKSLHKTIYYSVLLGTICEQFSTKIKLFAEIAGSVTDEMHQIEYSITKIIDFKESEKQNSFVVNLGVDEVLDR
ncbi:hypothetical protein L9F63_007125, partial [Diploptera punctata]